MAFDGITIACIAKECRDKLLNARIYKIAQPEKDELILTCKVGGGSKEQYRLLLSADASLPLCYFTQENKKSPMTAPNFCMLLRKHIQNGRIVDVTQPGLERILRFEIEHLDEMGDLCKKSLVVELMGKHSNIIFVDDKDKIIDSIKHISGAVSSVREVLPGRDYFIPKTTEKNDPYETTPESFRKLLTARSLPAYKAVYGSLTGFSPQMSQELCYIAGVDADLPTSAASEGELEKLAAAYGQIMEKVKSAGFSPVVYYENGAPKEYAAFPLTYLSSLESREFTDMSELLYSYYHEKNVITRIRQRSVDLRKIAQTALERNVKKYDLQAKQLKDTEKRETYRIYGELLQTYGYNVEQGAKKVTVTNYYDGKELTIPLDETMTPLENASKYFARYGKLKRTYEALTTLLKETAEEIEHLESVLNSIEIARKEEDLIQIKEEMIQSGYIKRKGGTKKEKVTSRPFHYISSDGFHIYVGKNNFQNDELTFKFAEGGDWWFHAKKIPGSHVVLKSGGKEVPDRTFEEAASLAAHYSKAGRQDKVEIDYIEKKHVKKPAGSKPGFVVYYTNYSMLATTDITHLKEVTE